MRTHRLSRPGKSLLSLTVAAALLVATGCWQSASASGGTQPDLVISMVANPAVVQPGAPVDWVVTVSNIGTDAATTPVVVDFSYWFAQGKAGTGAGWTCSAVPASRIAIDRCSLPSLAAGASASFTIHNTAPSYAGTYSLDAVVDRLLTIAESNETNNTASASYVVPVNGLNDLVPIVAQSFPNGYSVLVPGETVVYSVRAGSISAYNGPATMSITDTLPAGFVFESYLSLNPDGTPGPACTQASGVVRCAGVSSGNGYLTGRTDVQITARVPLATGLVDYAGTNTVTVDSDNTVVETIETNNTATVATPVSNTLPDLKLTMSTASNPVVAGAVFTQQVTVSNIGVAPSPFVTTYLSPPLAGTWVSGGGPGVTCVKEAIGRSYRWRCDSATGLAPGESLTFTLQLQAPTLAGTTTTSGRVSTARPFATTAVRDLDPNNDTASADAVVAVGATPDPTPTPVPATFADLTTSVTGPATAALNSKPTYVVTVSNLGTAPSGPHSFTVYLRGYDRIDSLVAPAEYVCFIRKDHPTGRYIDCSGGVAAGATATLQVTVAGVYSAGTWPVTSTVDTQGTVVESSETNNSATVNTTVS